MMLKLSGVIRKVFSEKVYGDFHKRVFLLQELNQKHPQIWSLEMWHDDTSELDLYKQGDVVECEVQVVGRMYEKSSGEENAINLLKCTSINKI